MTSEMLEFLLLGTMQLHTSVVPILMFATLPQSCWRAFKAAGEAWLRDKDRYFSFVTAWVAWYLSRCGISSSYLPLLTDDVIKAMIRAHEQSGFYSSLLSNVTGVVFFATPHRGSDLAYWDSLVGRLMNTATLSYTKNANLSKTLRVDSDRLKRISDSFAYRGWNFQIRSFYETEFMPGLNCRVSPNRSSAVLLLTYFFI